MVATFVAARCRVCNAILVRSTEPCEWGSAINPAIMRMPSGVPLRAGDSSCIACESCGETTNIYHVAWEAAAEPPIFWDKNDPLHREIMEVNAEAWRANQLREMSDKLDAIRRSLPWWARLYLRLRYLNKV